MVEREEEDLLLAVLNTTPMDRGIRRDDLLGSEGLTWLVSRGPVSSAEERDSLIAARDLLQEAVRRQPDLEALGRVLNQVATVPLLTPDGLEWRRQLPKGGDFAARVVLAWAQLRQDRPGRLRECANAQCERFLIDRSRSNQAKWCSMATCGNRAKARRHYERVRQPTEFG